MKCSYHSKLYTLAWLEGVHAMVGRGVSFPAGFVLGIVHRLKDRLTTIRCVDISLLKSPSVLEKWPKVALGFVW